MKAKKSKSAVRQNSDLESVDKKVEAPATTKKHEALMEKRRKELNDRREKE
jgi:hypothetical protein